MNDPWKPSPTAAERRARSRYRFRTTAAALREAWRAAAVDGQPDRSGRWWTPGVDALTRALAEGRDPRPACTRLGRARAAAGMSATDAMADLAALYRQLPEGEPSRGIVQVLVEAWVAATLVPDHAVECTAPLPTLATAGQLRTVLGEIAHHARRIGDPVGNRYTLLAIDLVAVSAGAGQADWENLAIRVELATRFRSAFPAGEPVVRLCPGGYVVLTAASGDLDHRTAALRRGLAEIGLGAARVWREELPDDIPAAYALFLRLAV